METAIVVYKGPAAGAGEEATEASAAQALLLMEQKGDDEDKDDRLVDDDDDDEDDDPDMPKEPIKSANNPSGYKGVYPARNGRWQAQANHASIGGFATKWEAGVAVAQAVYTEQLKKKKACGPKTARAKKLGWNGK